MELIMYHIVEVKTKKQEEEFLRLPALLYEINEDNKWVSPLYSDTRHFFDTRKNPLLKDGEAGRWLLYDVNKHLIGRIAAFYWTTPDEKQDPPMGYFGFFECSDDKKGAERLFRVAADWLKERGMKGMLGPFHLGGPGFFTGSLVRGFYEPAYGVPYNFSFYNDLFLGFGFRMASKYCTYRIPLADSTEWKITAKKAQLFYNNPDYRIAFFDSKNCEKFSQDFTRIFNQVWAGFPGMAAMTEKRALDRCKMLRLFLEKKTILFLYYQEEPVAFLIAVPDVHRVFRKFKGKYNLFDRLVLWFVVKVLKRVKILSGLIYGVVPEHQGKGIEAALLHSLQEVVSGEKLKYDELRLNRVGEFAPETRKTVQLLAGKFYQQYVMYQIMFDEIKETNDNS